MIPQSKIEKVNGEEEKDNNDESGLQFINQFECIAVHCSESGLQFIKSD